MVPSLRERPSHNERVRLVLSGDEHHFIDPRQTKWADFTDLHASFTRCVHDQLLKGEDRSGLQDALIWSLIWNPAQLRVRHSMSAFGT